MSRQPCALVMAGGTGGHIFPGLAVAEALRARGWRVHWLGVPGSMEDRLVPPRGFAFEPVEFGGVRGKGLKTLALLPLRLTRALCQARAVLKRVKPDVVLGLGGYITVPGGLAAKLAGVPILLHEQNSIAGMSNRWLAKLAERSFSAYPAALPGGEWIGNPLRTEFLQQPAPAARFAGRSGPLRLLVVGGSLGAQALNQVLPLALALIPFEQRPIVTHQGGEKQIDALRAAYAEADVQATLTPFIRDTAQAFADADLVIARAGASTVTELAAIGAAAAFVPFPHAVDDHQTHNARFLVDAGAGWLLPQSELTPERLAGLLQGLDRAELLARAEKAHALRQTGAVEAMVAACERLLEQKERN
ncbi:undecaprenyldiphospho-muramoylpentapeptide beta-N-acetylglucosaminyltransferase [Malikia granosa]|uniref:UDP-N-acetylglucosamine--N-acetylmuramyl-(pentapeptide) pyrophosphoryl-undecaprenol N-acetylglucosamine transferase n=1 Tax=Malikia granosa TaxID=263067 RepID=A0A2S9K998_9BURK|nr:undecaprenyldiphospho-muramoylpentapeptide beta-N-acetylglucosaminyltransferase [Malikia granosa]PRD67021.1 undecaprenyldiphospho-muramoylpentapeptide beta-N-acetylglucosaminyltransferase [Malikia granosa]